MTFVLKAQKYEKIKDFFDYCEFESFKTTIPNIDEISEQEAREKFKEFLANDPLDMDETHHIIIGETKDGEKAGLIWFCNREPFWRFKEKHVWIYNLHIIPKYRRMDLARQLMIKAEEWAKKQNLKSMALHVLNQNTAARKLYESLNYKLVETHNESCFYEKVFSDTN